MGGFVPPGVPGHSADISLPYDPEGARALLEEYAAEKGIELPLKVTLATKNDQAEPEIALLVPSSWLSWLFPGPLWMVYE